MNLYIIRHGQTSANVEERINNYDETLTETGIMQANLAKEKIKDIPLDLIICSPLTRTKQTMEIININNIPVEYDDRIKEIDGGKFTGQKIPPELHPNIWFQYYHKPIEDAEPAKRLFNRSIDFIREISEKYQGKNILVVTHGGVIRCIMSYFERDTSGDLSGPIVNNCEIIAYKITRS